ncbi:MAG: GNAT family N-acetyltransferase [Acholeplasmatales bacterium]|nr:GNAT family N-acetyltransferase [Acholeplasmatales bacterium]
MKLIGKDIIIRDLKYDDAEAFYEYASSDLVGPSAGWKPVPSLKVAKRVINSYIYAKDVYAIALKENNKLIGTFSFYHENLLRKYKYATQVGFSLSNLYWNRGIMTDALGLCVRYLFEETDTEIIEVCHEIFNYGSKRVIEKNHFKYDGRIRKYKTLYDDRVVDVDFYSLTKEEYEKEIKNEEFKA